MPDLLELLTWRRAQGSESQAAFCARYLEPIFGAPDTFGNYVADIGDWSGIMFSAHHDSVHRTSGRQNVECVNGIARLAPEQSAPECLGADCATGIWIILDMIRRGVPGRYVIHAAEESGGRGAQHILANRPDAYAGARACIAFDRKGYDSVITHQGGRRTASDAFAESLADAIGLGMRPDSGGVFTDSEVYADDVPECTNVSVGYFGAHTADESQDIAFAMRLADRLALVDWQSLPIVRDPAARDDWRNAWLDDWRDDCRAPRGAGGLADMEDLIAEHADILAEILADDGWSAESLARAIAERIM